MAFEAETFNVLIVETIDADVAEIEFDAERNDAVAEVLMFETCD